MHTRNRSLVVLLMAIVAGVLNGYVIISAQFTRAARQAIAPAGRLRVGVYPGSPTSMIRGQASGDEKGVTVDLGREFGRRLGIPVELVEFRQIADVLEALKQGAVDFTVTNATPARAKDMDFSGVDPWRGTRVSRFLHVQQFRHWLTSTVPESGWGSPPAGPRTRRSLGSSRMRRWCQLRPYQQRWRCWPAAKSTHTRQTRRFCLRCPVSRRAPGFWMADGALNCSQWPSQKAARRRWSRFAGSRTL